MNQTTKFKVYLFCYTVVLGLVWLFLSAESMLPWKSNWTTVPTEAKIIIGTTTENWIKGKKLSFINGTFDWKCHHPYRKMTKKKSLKINELFNSVGFFFCFALNRQTAIRFNHTCQIKKEQMKTWNSIIQGTQSHKNLIVNWKCPMFIDDKLQWFILFFS